MSSGSSALSVSVGADKFALDPHAAENVNVTGYQSETFSLGLGFGAETIQGFSAGGGSSDVLSLGLSMFNGPERLQHGGARRGDPDLEQCDGAIGI